MEGREAVNIRTFVILVGLLALTATVAAGVPRTESQDYIAVGGDATILCDPLSDGTGVGGACFTLDGSESSAKVTIQDENVPSVGGFFELANAAGDRLTHGAFCGSTTASVPVGAKYLFVYVDNALGPLDCPGKVGSGTRGTITAQFG